MPTREKIEQIVKDTFWDVEKIEVDLNNSWSINSLDPMKGVKISKLMIGNTGISSIDVIIESSKDCLKSLWMPNMSCMDKNNLISVGEFVELEELVMSYNENLTNEVMESLPKKWKSLKMADFSANDIYAIDHFCNWENLEILNINMTEIVNIKKLETLKKLKSLDITGTHVVDTKCLSNNPDLIILTDDPIYAQNADIAPYDLGPQDNLLQAVNLQDRRGYRRIEIRDDRGDIDINNDQEEQQNTQPAQTYENIHEAAAATALRRQAEAQGGLMYNGETRAEYPEQFDAYRTTTRTRRNLEAHEL
jgi:hypothetical protein